MAPVVRSEMVYDLSFPPERVWPILSKTDWINRSLGLPPVRYQISPEPTGGTNVVAQARFFGTELRWHEWPFEWLENEFYRVRRTFEAGPITEAELELRFACQKGGTEVRVSSTLHPRNRVGEFLARRVLGPKATRQMRELVAHLEEFLAGERRVPLPKLSKRDVNETGLDVGLAKLRENAQPAELVRLLERLLRDSADVELAHLRPLGLARTWQKGEWDVLRLFLQATRAGLLDLSWEVLCPNCRSTRTPPARTLREVERTVHCEACQIRFDGEFDKSVELKFTVNEAIRPVQAGTFCLAGPGSKPHVVSQIYLAAGESRRWKLPPLEATARLRSPQISHAQVLSAAEVAGLNGKRLLCHRDRFTVAPPEANASLTAEACCTAVNPNLYPVLLVLERLAWSGEILTAARVTNWQEFRDLFAREVLSPEEQIKVGQQLVLFTDLQGSTAIYNGIGDAPAYALVRDHFKVLFKAVEENHGAVVKTIGDAVMAVFSRVNEALAAVARMHRDLATVERGLAGEKQLRLKSSLHSGPCLAVNANDRLDYFGTTVNLAARMVGCCKGGDVTVSRDIYEHPETIEFVRRFGLATDPTQVKFRGFEASHQVWRITLVEGERA
ncbi:MAG: DUF5939 domain-containing protein [Verrucomicrobiota bacterium]